MILAPSPGHFPALFPFHLVVDERLVIRQLGTALKRILGPAVLGEPLNAHVIWRRPVTQVDSMAALQELSGRLCVLELQLLPLQLKGQVLVDQNRAFFLGNPVVQSVEQLRTVGIRLSDIPHHDALGDALVMLQTKDMTIANLVKQRTRELETLANRDALTGVGNRHAFNLDLQAQFDSRRQGDQQFSLLLLDVDHFKQFNDRHGHLAGDDCLMAVARHISEQAGRGADRVYRYGGEEFAVLLPYTGSDGACEVAERIVQDLAQSPLWISSTGRWHTVTVSVGVASAEPHAPTMQFADTPRALIHRADTALYEAKRAGRSCYRVAAPEPAANVA